MNTYGTIISSNKIKFILKALGQEFLYPQLFNEYSAQLGTPIIDMITIADNLESPLYKLEIDSAIIDVDAPNIIKSTYVEGRAGSVNEYISQDNYRVIIKGGLFSTNKDIYPEDGITILNELKRIGIIEVTSQYLELLGIRNLIIKRLQLSQKAGRISAQAFQLDCISDTPYELEVNNV